MHRILAIIDNQMCYKGLASPQLAPPSSLNILMLFFFSLQSVHIYTLFSQHLHLYNPITNPRVNNETLNCEFLRVGWCFLHCPLAFANNQLLTQVIPLKASSSYIGGKITVIPIQIWI